MSPNPPRPADSETPESVHLAEWPQADKELNVRELQVFALSEAFKGPFERPADLLAMLTPDDVLVEDDAGYAVAVNASVTPELAEEGLARELGHRIQNLRKAAG